MRRILLLLVLIVLAGTAHAASPEVSSGDLSPIAQGPQQPSEQLPLDPLQGAQPLTCRDDCKFAYLDCIQSHPYSYCSAQRTTCLAAC